MCCRVLPCVAVCRSMLRRASEALAEEFRLAVEGVLQSVAQCCSERCAAECVAYC